MQKYWRGGGGGVTWSGLREETAPGKEVTVEEPWAAHRGCRNANSLQKPSELQTSEERH